MKDVEKIVSITATGIKQVFSDDQNQDINSAKNLWNITDVTGVPAAKLKSISLMAYIRKIVRDLTPTDIN
jgi:hypothetical protein